MNDLWDRIGISTSLVCVVHCLITPILVVFLPFLTASVMHGWFHFLVVVIAIPIAFWAFWNGYRLHGKRRMLWFAAFGLFAMTTALSLGHSHDQAESGIMIVAGLSLSYAHFLNLRATHVHKC